MTFQAFTQTDDNMPWFTVDRECDFILPSRNPKTNRDQKNSVVQDGVASKLSGCLNNHHDDGKKNMTSLHIYNEKQ